MKNKFKLIIISIFVSLSCIGSEPTVILGAVSREQIYSVLLESVPELRKCAPKTLKEKKSFLVRINFIIGTEGQTQKLKLKSKTKIAKTELKCLEEKLSKLKYKKPLKGVAEVSTVINFQSKSDL